MKLDTPVSELPFVGPTYEKRLEKLEIKTVGDLLHHVPHRYQDFSLVTKIKNIQVGETVTIKGQVVEIKNQYTKQGKKIQTAKISDGASKINAIWFNQPFLVNSLPEGTLLSLAGKVGWWAGKPALVSPEYEKLTMEGTHTGRLVPVYHETAGVSSKWIRARIKAAFEKLAKDQLVEFLPAKIIKEANFLNFKQAIKAVHYPKSKNQAEAGRRRLAFNELLELQLDNIKRRSLWQKNKVSQPLSVNPQAQKEFTNSLPFKLTSAQKRAVQEIISDLTRDVPMNRLLEGDVGSGKTVVATLAAFITFVGGAQTVIMAPTQILAQQHFQTLTKMLQPFKARLSLITGPIKKTSFGRSDIIIGTHTLIRGRINFDQVGLVIIDEQHRFGVKQRGALVKKSKKGGQAPHVLTMTATPIPRTVALTFYGNLDLSVLDELPPGRPKITTWIVLPNKRQGAYKWMAKQIKNTQSQAFVICPLIEESDKETLQSVRAAKSEFEKLKEIFPNLKLGLIHGRQSAKEKNSQIEKFKKGKTDILVATPVVEVGIDVPAASIMIIEGAQRFGLAALHQLRGRIGRGRKKSYCLLFPEDPSVKATARLEALKTTRSGFELAEMDLKLRGPGEIFGTAQSGFPELKIASWSDIDLIRLSQKVAQEMAMR